MILLLRGKGSGKPTKTPPFPTYSPTPSPVTLSLLFLSTAHLLSCSLAYDIVPSQCLKLRITRILRPLLPSLSPP
jgi:hypothetical protein